MHPIPEHFPESAWRPVFKRWRDIVEPVTDTPLPFHYANLLAVLSSQLGDMAVLDEGVDTFLNFFIFSYGRTGTRKSFAMSLVKQHLVKRLAKQHFTSLPSVNSAEGLMRVLATAPHNVLLAYDEVKHLLSVAGRDGSNVEAIINQGFGLHDIGTTVRAASESLANIPYFLNIIVNGTPVHMNVNVDESLFHGGLVNRFFVFAAKPDLTRHLPKSLPVNVEAATEFASLVSVHMEAWRNIIGCDSAGRPKRAEVKISIGDEAMEVYGPWDRKHDFSTKTENEREADPVMRIDLYARKLAALYCFWETEHPITALSVTAEQMQAAIDVAEFCQASILHMTAGWNIRSLAGRADALAETRVEDYLKKHGCRTIGELRAGLKLSVSEVRKAVLSLTGINEVKMGMEAPAKVHLHDCHCNTVVRLAAPPAAETSTATFEEPPMYVHEDD